MSSVIESGIYISLKQEYYRVIENDMNLFRTNTHASENRYKFTIGKFLNNIFLNMYDGRKFDPNSVKRTRKIGAKGFNIKINSEIVFIMEQAGLNVESDYSADFAAYYIQFIEEYCKFPLNEREKIFYKQIINKFEDEICLKSILKIQKNDGNSTDILPYAVKQSDEINRNYLTGFSLIEKNGKYIYNKTICIPLIKILSFQRTGKINKKNQIVFKNDSDIKSYDDMKKYIEKRFISDGVIYLSDELRDVSVRLSNAGMEMLYSRTQYRPYFYETDKTEQNIIHFRATRLQTFMYFFTFGCEAEILKPNEYRKLFVKEYKKALKNYVKKVDFL